MPKTPNSKSNKIAPPGFFTAAGAMQVLGVTPGRFYSFVNKGLITGVKPPGYRESYYRVDRIREFAREYQMLLGNVAPDSLVFDLGRVEDIEPIRAIVAQECGITRTIPSEVMRAWLWQNPQSIHVLRRGKDVVGYISMLALSEEIILKRMTGELWNKSIPLEEVKPFVPDSTIKLYIAEMAVDLDAPDQKALAFRLIMETLRMLVRMTQEEKIEIEEIYTVGTSKFGIQICQTLKMEPMTYLPSGVSEERIPFKMDVKTNQSHIFGRYRELIHT